MNARRRRRSGRAAGSATEAAWGSPSYAIPCDAPRSAFKRSASTVNIAYANQEAPRVDGLQQRQPSVCGDDAPRARTPSR